MPDDTTHTSQVPIRELPPLAASLGEAIGRMPDPENTRAAVGAALTADCVQCGIRLTGADVLALPDSEDPRLERIRHGYCARNGCDCHFYRVTRNAHTDLDWTRLLSETNASVEDQAIQAAAELARQRKQVRKAKAIRIAVFAAALIGVYIARQVYFGGSIPLLREPQKFEVDKHPGAEEFHVPPTQDNPPQRFEVDRKARPQFEVDRQ